MSKDIRGLLAASIGDLVITNAEQADLINQQRRLLAEQESVIQQHLAEIGRLSQPQPLAPSDQPQPTAQAAEPTAAA